MQLACSELSPNTCTVSLTSVLAASEMQRGRWCDTHQVFILWDFQKRWTASLSAAPWPPWKQNPGSAEALRIPTQEVHWVSTKEGCALPWKFPLGKEGKRFSHNKEVSRVLLSSCLYAADAVLLYSQTRLQCWLCRGWDQKAKARTIY